MERTHLSVEPVRSVLPVDPWGKGAGAYKPKGFWYEVDGDWRRWCESEMPSWVEGKMLHRVELNGERMLNIRNVAEFDAFHRTYVRDFHRYVKAPDWHALAEEYDGLEIAPYLWERRLCMDTSWYYGWDCASGVIWRPRGVTVGLVDQPSTPGA